MGDCSKSPATSSVACGEANPRRTVVDLPVINRRMEQLADRRCVGLHRIVHSMATMSLARWDSGLRGDSKSGSVITWGHLPQLTETTIEIGKVRKTRLETN